MKIKEILKHVDHTLLLQPSTWEEIKQICDDAMKYGTASVCIPPCYVKQAAEYMGEKMAVCTVIGFPNGNMTTAVKEFETKDAIANGASEIDMVINIGWLKDKKYELIENEIRTLKAACGEKILKVIIETCFLTTEEKIKMCEIVTAAGADYIKTSTGFGGSGATNRIHSPEIIPAERRKSFQNFTKLQDIRNICLFMIGNFFVVIIIVLVIHLLICSCRSGCSIYTTNAGFSNRSR